MVHHGKRKAERPGAMEMPKLMQHILGKLSKCEWLIGGKLKMYFGISLLREEGLERFKEGL